MTDAPACETCRFWVRSTISPKKGSCRRYPPTADGWPETIHFAWCGEHAAQPASAAAAPEPPRND